MALNRSKSFRASQVLDFLDNSSVHNFGSVPVDLEHPYFYTANSRLTLFADDSRWAIVFEKSGYANRAGAIELETSSYGNCLRNLEPVGVYYHGNSNLNSFGLVEPEDLGAIAGEFETVSPDATDVVVRGQALALPEDIREYAKWVPEISAIAEPVVTFQDLARYLTFEHESLCRATDAELRASVPGNLPLLMRIDEWHQKSYACPNQVPTGAKPSSYETFQMIADVLASGETDRYQPNVPPNSHWTNWPEAGAL